MHTLHLYQIRTIIEVASKRCIKKPFWSTQWCKGGDHKASPFWVWIIHSCNFLSYLLNKCFFVKRTNNEKMTNSKIFLTFYSGFSECHTFKDGSPWNSLKNPQSHLRLKLSRRRACQMSSSFKRRSADSKKSKF